MTPTNTNYYGAPNFFGGNPAAFFTNPDLRFNFNGISTTTATAGAPGNLSGLQQALQFFSDPAVQALPEKVQQQFAANPGLFGSNPLDLKGMIEQQGINQERTTNMLIEAQAKQAREANEMGRKNLILGSLLKMPGQIADTLVQASTAHLPYEREARQMMANTGANLQAGYSNLANMNTQFGNQVTNLFSNAASYRPTIAGLAGKYF